MKLKGLTKLIMAGTALAATAATLTTSTYAWYVTNSKANVDQIQGMTKGEAIGGSLLVALDATTTSGNTTTYAPGNYTSKISLDITTTNSNGLWPMSKTTNPIYAVTSDSTPDSEKTYYTLSETTYTAAQDLTEFAANTTYYEKTANAGDWVDDKGKTSTEYLMTFKFWIKSQDAATVNTKLTTVNTTETANVKKQVALSSANTPTGVTKGTEFAVDAVHALRMNIAKQEFVFANNAYTTSDSAEGTTYAVDTISTSYTSPTWATADAGDANQYYFGVVGTAGALTNKTNGTSVDAPSGTWTSVSLAANVDTLLTFNVWLEGTDAGCFDSCINQKFTFAFEFELPQNNNNSGAGA